MNIIITGNLEITDAMKSHITAKIVKLAKYVEDLNSASVILSVEKRRHSAVVAIGANGTSFTSKETTANTYSSINYAFTKVESRFRKRAEKRDSKSRKAFKRMRREVHMGFKQNFSKEYLNNGTCNHYPMESILEKSYG